MDPRTIGYVIGAIVVLLLVGVAVLLLQRQRSQHLRQRFGPEYERSVAQLGDERQAEAELRGREKRVERLEIRQLAPAERDRFATAWQQVQARFVDGPQAAIGEADGLIVQVMQAQGYPVGDFDERAADVSVDHPTVVSNYRAGHLIAMRNQSGKASTEDLRQAMVHYRSLFTELVGPYPTGEPTTDKEEIKTDGPAQRTEWGGGQRHGG
jgi:hypothetical protein